jgi:hypothetical protein
MRIMPLQSKLFKGDQRLEACLIHDSAHVTPGTAGEFVTKIQKALFILDGAVIDPSEQGIYGPSTADAVLAYKKRRKIINYSYQTQADNIVGKMTIASLDNELTQVRLVPVNPRWRDQIVRTGRQQRQGEFQSRLLLGFGISTGAPSAVPIGSPTTFDLGDHSISAKPEMPPELSPIEIKIDGVSPDPTPNTFFDWEVRVVFDESSTTFGRAATVFNDGFTVSRVLGGTFSFSWPWIRGGNLTMHVEGQVRGGSVEATFTGRITGTDPAIGDVRAALGDDTLRRIANVESGFHQFETDPNSGRVVPKFNRNWNTNPPSRGDGGAGICQITPPTANEIWDWKANVRKGKQIFGGARGAAAAYLGQHAQNGQFVNSLGLPNAEAIRREAIQNFRGGHFWQWNPAGNRWEASPPNNYVDLVLNASP